MRLLLPIIVAVPLTIVSCSIVPHRPEAQSELVQVEIDKQNKQAYEMAIKQMDSLVVKAKSHPETKSYIMSDLFLKANMSLLDGDYVTSSILFKAISEIDPSDVFVQKKYAISLIRLGDLEGAQVVLENLFKSTQEEKVGMILAGVYTGIDQETKAQKLYQQLLVANPQNEDACVFLGKSYALNKQMKRATTQLQTCAKHNPRSGIYDYYLGKLDIDQGQPVKAMHSFHAAVKKQPGLTQAVSALGIMYEDKEQFAQAIKLYETHLKVDANDNVILNRMVQILFQKEKYQEVIPYAERLSDLEPENLNLKVKLGVLYTDAKKFPEAVSVFKDLLAAAPESDKILYYLGAIYQEMEEFQQSIEYFNQIPATSGLYTDSSVQMANMLSSLAQNEFMSKDGEKWQSKFVSYIDAKMIELKDLKTELGVLKAGYYEGIGQFSKALGVLAAVQDEKNFSTSHKFYLASLFEKEKKYEDSKSIILSVIDQEPKNAHAWNYLGYSMLLRDEDVEKAHEYIKKALVMSPQDGYIMDSMGWYYYKKGELKKALTHLQTANKKVPNDVEILKHLAIIHSDLKDFLKAKFYLETALKHARLPYEKLELISSIEKLDSDRLPASQKFGGE